MESSLIAGVGAGVVGSATLPGAKAALQGAVADGGFRASLADAGLIVSGTPQSGGEAGRIRPGSWRLPIQQGPTAADALEGSTQRLRGGDGRMPLGKTALGAATLGSAAGTDSGSSSLGTESSSHSAGGTALLDEGESASETGVQPAASAQTMVSAEEMLAEAAESEPPATEPASLAACGELQPSTSVVGDRSLEVVSGRVSGGSRTTDRLAAGEPTGLAGRDGAALNGIEPGEADVFRATSEAVRQPAAVSPEAQSLLVVEGTPVMVGTSAVVGMPAAEGESGAGSIPTESALAVQQGAALLVPPAASDRLLQAVPSASRTGAEVTASDATADLPPLPGPGTAGNLTEKAGGRAFASAGTFRALDLQGASATSSGPMQTAGGAADAVLPASMGGVQAAFAPTIAGVAAGSSRQGLSTTTSTWSHPVALAATRDEVLPAARGTGRTGTVPAALRQEADGAADASRGVTSSSSVPQVVGVPPPGAAEELQGTAPDVAVPGPEAGGPKLAESVRGQQLTSLVQAGSGASGGVAPAAVLSSTADLPTTKAEASAKAGRKTEARETAVKRSVPPDAATASLVSPVPAGPVVQTNISPVPLAVADATSSQAAEAGGAVEVVSSNGSGRALVRAAGGVAKQGSGVQTTIDTAQSTVVAGRGESAVPSRSGTSSADAKDAFAGVMEGRAAAARMPAETVIASTGAALAGTSGAAVQTASQASSSASQSSVQGGLGHGSAGSQGVAEAALPVHTTLVSTPTVLEVGVASGTNGWLKVRAEMNGEGAVAASVVASTASAADALHKDLPALSAYLKQESVGVSSLVVTRAESGAMTQQDAAMSFGSGAQGRQPGSETAAREALADAALVEAQGLPAAMPAGSLATGVASGLTAGLGSGSGGWLNVVA